MIKSTVKDYAKYSKCHPLFPEAFKMMFACTAASLDGTTVSESGIKCMVQSYPTNTPENKKMEAHRKYIDIQYVIEGSERVYLGDVKDFKTKVEYNPEKDVEFFFSDETLPTVESMLLRAGEFMVFYPEDAHKPGCINVAPTSIKKVVMKIPVEA